MLIELQHSIDKEVTPLAILQSMLKENSKNLAVQRLILNQLKGEQFCQELHKYIDQMLKKGVPSLFRNIKPLYKFETYGITKVIENIYATYDKQDPAYQVWILALMALHYDYTHQHEKALKFIDDAIKHTATLPDLYVFKAKIQKHNGLHTEAAASYKEAIALDKADRNLNARCAKYHLKINKVKEAEEIMLAFSRDEDKLNVHEMQCMWYELECGNAYFRLGDYIRAMEYYKWVETDFETIWNDQYDFHIFCIRKCTLMAYSEMIENNQHFYRNKYYARVMTQLPKLYMKLHTNKNECIEANIKANSKEDAGKIKEKLNTIASPLDDAYKAIRYAAMDNSGVELHLEALEIMIAKGKWNLACRSAIYLYKNRKENDIIRVLIEKLKLECNNMI